MENPNPPSLKLRAPYFIAFLLLLLLLSLSRLQLLSSAFIVPDRYFINCGSRSNAVVSENRNFVPDRYYTGGDFVDNPNPSSNASLSPLYRTARISRKAFSYELEIAGNGTHLVRLQFYPFSSPTANLSAAEFSVVADSKFLLLSNFTVPKGSDLPEVREFLVNIGAGKFHIYFIPESSSLAYVNAIEVLLAFEGTTFMALTDIGVITPAGRDPKNMTGDELRSQALGSIYRIKAGPQAIEEVEDVLWRKWAVDDPYLLDKSAAINTNAYSGPFSRSEYTENYAPGRLYRTAKILSSPNRINISWSFGVSKNARHFLRAHFCNIVGLTNNYKGFDLYIYNRYSLWVDPYVWTIYYPTYIDFVVKSDDSGFLNISVVPDALPAANKKAFLNGLEILEFMTKDSKFVPPSNSNSKRKRPAILAGSAGGVGLLGLILISVCMLRRKKIKAAKLQSAGASVGLGRIRPKGSENDDSCAAVLSIANLGLRIPLADILLATSDFHPSSEIGKGGFGKVYKGTLADGRSVAVKRSNPEYGQGIAEFRTEILVLSLFRHRHLVSLVGYCDDSPEMILVYEFIDNGNLRSHLYGDPNASPLSWKQRLEICIGSAKGIHYLHTSSDKAMIHRDIKSTNILLTENFVAKVCDFGLSRSGALDRTHVTTGVKGTIGYLDPEYFKCFQLTEKSDVYSFGVVLLEVLCARKPVNDKRPRGEVNLAEWAMSMHQRGKLKDIVDASIADEVDSNSLRKYWETVAKCLKDHGWERPDMKDVLWDLKYTLQLHETIVCNGGAVMEDSGTGALLGLTTLPWDGGDEEEEEGAEDDDFSAVTASNPSDVFSQIRVHDAR